MIKRIIISKVCCNTRYFESAEADYFSIPMKYPKAIALEHPEQLAITILALI